MPTSGMLSVPLFSKILFVREFVQAVLYLLGGSGKKLAAFRSDSVTPGTFAILSPPCPCGSPSGSYSRGMVRPGSWSRPAGGSPVRVIAGEPGSRPRFVVERRRAGRGVKSLCGGSKHAGRSITRILQPRQSYSGGAEPLMSRRRQHLAGWRSGDAPAGSLRGKGSGTRAWSGPEQERPVCLACVGQRPGV